MRRRPLPTKPITTAAAETPLSQATFAFSATRIAAAQIIHSAGYRFAQSSALNTLADAAGRYLSAVASSAAATAASDGRTQSSLHDVIIALETLASAQGFTGASNLSRRILSSSTLTDLSRFVRYSEEIPFSQVLRWRSGSGIVSGSGRRPGSGCGHIPKWLPAVPDMRGEREVERGERLYGCLDYNKMRDGIIEEERKERFEGFFVDEKMRIELPKNREKLRFKIGDREGFLGVNLRNGVCRKRISYENRIINYGNNDDKDTNMKVKCNGGFNGSEEAAIGDRLQPLLYYRRRNRR